VPAPDRRGYGVGLLGREQTETTACRGRRSAEPVSLDRVGRGLRGGRGARRARSALSERAALACASPRRTALARVGKRGQQPARAGHAGARMPVAARASGDARDVVDSLELHGGKVPSRTCLTPSPARFFSTTPTADSAAWLRGSSLRSTAARSSRSSGSKTAQPIGCSSVSPGSAPFVAPARASRRLRAIHGPRGARRARAPARDAPARAGVGETPSEGGHRGALRLHSPESRPPGQARPRRPGSPPPPQRASSRPSGARVRARQ